MKVSAPIVLLGASYAEHWHLPSIAGHPVINRGVSGHETQDILARFDHDVIAARPRAVILWGYMNNIVNLPHGQGEQGEARARDDYRQMIARGRAAGIEVIVATDITVGLHDDWGNVIRSSIGRMIGREGYEAYVNRHVLALNQWLTETAADERMLLLHLQPVLCDARGQRTKASRGADGAHVTPSGYRALTDYSRPILEEHFRLSPAA